MFKTGAHINIGDWQFPYLCDCEIVSDIEALTDTCRITLPRKHNWNFKNVALGDDPLLKRKDAVSVSFGYDGRLTPEFVGYVKDIKPGVPVGIECEDTMMLLKQDPITKALPKGTTLKELLSAILPVNISVQAIDTVVGDWRISKATPAKVLEELKSKMGLSFYFRLIGSGTNVKPVLYAGWQYWLDNRKEHQFEFGHNIIDYSDLTYKVKDDVRLKLKVINVTGDNKREEYEIGDDDGEIRTVHYYKLDAATMKERAEKDLDRFKYTGYRGSFTSFGEPSVRIGDVINITGNQYHPDGKYLVKKVTKNCSAKGGIKQTIEPGKQINEVNET